MSDTLSQLTRRQQMAAHALVNPANVLLTDVEIARQIGVSDRTLRRLRNTPRFQSALDELRQQPEYQPTPYLQDRMLEADMTLWEMVKSDNPKVALRGLELYYKRLGIIQQAGREVPQETNAIKVVFESRNLDPDAPAPIVEVL